MQPSQGNLYIQLVDSTGNTYINDDNDETDNGLRVDMEEGRPFFNLLINGMEFKDINLISLGNPSLQLMASQNDSFYIQQTISAQGRNKADAAKNAEMVIYSFSQADSILNLHSNLYIPKTAKWRDQEIKLRIAIPEGKKIRFADNIDLWHANVKGDANYDDTYFANTTWTVEKGKVKCIEGENHRDADTEKKSEEKTDKPKKDNSDNDSEKESDSKDGDF